jgi:hypothetical protein
VLYIPYLCIVSRTHCVPTDPLETRWFRIRDARLNPLTFIPSFIKCSNTLSTVSVLKSHLFKAPLPIVSGVSSEVGSPNFSSYSSFSLSDSSEYLIPSLWNFKGTLIDFGQNLKKVSLRNLWAL